MKRTLSKKLKKSVSAILAAAMSLSLFTAIPVSADIGRTTYNYDGYSVDYNVTNEWDGAQTVELTVSNTGTDSILNWALKYDAEGEISNLWNADLYEQNGDEYVIKNVGWNFEIAPSQSITYGYTLSGNDLTLPKNFEIYSKRVDKTEGYDVQYNITKSWDVGVEGNIVITNTSSAPIEAWTLSFDSNFTIDNLWNGRVIENNELSYTISNQIVTSAIQPNTSFTVGFNGTKAADIEMLLNNFKLTEVVIGDGNSVIPLDPSADKTGITANATYIYESGNIIVSWNTNNPKGTFNILMSEDGNNFTSIGVVEDKYEYVYIPNSTVNKIYFKVKQTTEDNSIESNIAAVYSFNSDGEKFPYTLFAVSDKDGAITINSDNFCINGDVSTNGTIVSNNNVVNINGAKIEKANNDMLYIFDKIEALYFSNNNVDEYNSDYILNDMNINIITPMNIIGKTSMTGSININTALKAFEDIELYGDVKNTNNCVIFSKYRDITIDSTNVNLSGLIYAPFGNVQITAQNLNLNDVVIIADTITLNSPNINTNYGDKTAQLIGNTSDPLDIPYDEWKYMKDENENNFPDFFEDTSNWGKLKDTDGDELPDPVEVFLGSDINVVDTDGDMLPDGYEVLVLMTDSTVYDSYEKEMSDGECDIDEDGLSNYQEYILGTNPYNNDSDGDDLKDGDEINIYDTDPLKYDSDNDGIKDGDEIRLNMDPLSPSATIITKTFTPSMFNISEEYYYPEVTLSANAEAISSFSMNIYLSDLNYNSFVPGYIGNAFEFTCNGNIDKAIVKFIIPEELYLSEEFLPAIYYYNMEKQCMEELNNQIIDGNTVTAELSHFSVYTVLNKKQFDSKYKWAAKNEKYLPLEDDLLNDMQTNADIVFVLDDSGSMSDNDLNNDRKNATMKFIEQLSTTDRIALVKFSNYSSLLYGLNYVTDECKTNFEKALNKLNNLGGTDGSSGLNTAINNLINPDRVKCIIFLTDGEDTNTKYSYDKLIKDAVDKNITIFTIGLGYYVNSRNLVKIAQETGGEYFSISDSDQLYNCFNEIRELTIDYLIDSNNDGISDYDTWKLITGQYMSGFGMVVTPFGTPDFACSDFKEWAKKKYEEIQSNNDYDNDGIINGTEITIKNNGDKKYVYMHSNPIKFDTDYDGYSDAEERLTYKTNPNKYTSTLTENQINHLALSGTYIASTYKNGIVYERNWQNVIGMSIGNNVYSRQSIKNIYISELANDLELILSKNENERENLIKTYIQSSIIFLESSISGKCLKNFYDDLGIMNYEEALTKHLDSFFDTNQAINSLDDLANKVNKCTSTEEINNALVEWRRSPQYSDLTKVHTVDSALSWENIKSSFNSAFEGKSSVLTGIDIVIRLGLIAEAGEDAYNVYTNLHDIGVQYDQSRQMLKNIKSHTKDNDLILAIDKVLSVLEQERNNEIVALEKALEAGMEEFLYNAAHFLIGISGPIGVAVEIGISYGNLLGNAISTRSEYAARTCCAASVADAMSDVWATHIKYCNILTPSIQTAWYTEETHDYIFEPYFWAILNTRRRANNCLIVVEEGNFEDFLAFIGIKFEGNIMDLIKQNEIELSQEYLIKYKLYINMHYNY